MTFTTKILMLYDVYDVYVYHKDSNVTKIQMLYDVYHKDSMLYDVYNKDSNVVWRLSQRF